MPPQVTEVSKEAPVAPVVEPTPEPEVKDSGLMEVEPTEPDIFKNISIGDFKEGDIKPAEEKPVEEPTKPAEEPAKEVTPEPVKVPAKKPVIERDLTFADEADRPLFKQMSNEAFDKLSVIYKNNKENSTKLTELQKKAAQPNETIFANEHAYLITPQYQEASRKANLAADIVDHWERQLINIRNAKQWTALVIDPKTGELTETEPQAASEEAEVKVIRALRVTSSQQDRLTHELNGIVANHKARHGEVNEFIDKTISEYFPGLDKPDHPSAAIQKAIEDNLHPAFNGDPLVKLLKVTGAANAMLRAENHKLKQEIEKINGIKKDVVEAPPPASALKSGGGGVKPVGVEFTDFEKERNK